MAYRENLPVILQQVTQKDSKMFDGIVQQLINFLLADLVSYKVKKVVLILL